MNVEAVVKLESFYGDIKGNFATYQSCTVCIVDIEDGNYESRRS